MRKFQDRLEWTARIADAVALDLLVLHAEPIVNLATGKVEQADVRKATRTASAPKP